MIRILPATPNLLARTRVGRPAKTMRCLVAVDDTDKVLAVAGMYADGNRLVLFADLSDTLRQNKRALVRGWRALMSIAVKKNATVHAVADPQIAGSRALLEHMGFEHLTGDLYQWHS